MDMKFKPKEKGIPLKNLEIGQCFTLNSDADDRTEGGVYMLTDQPATEALNVFAVRLTGTRSGYRLAMKRHELVIPIDVELSEKL